MGQLVEGKWEDVWYDTESTKGKFVRKGASFRNWITAPGETNPIGESGFEAEAGRYHLYVSLACPWAHRTLIFRKLKGLEDIITISIVNAFMGSEGWTFEPGEGVIPDTENQVSRMHEIYTLADPTYSGRVTVPVLWDKKRKTIVSNESSEIIRMFNTAFDGVGALVGDFYPEDLRADIDAVNDSIYTNINNGVYKAGFATTQVAYDDAVAALFDTLDSLEERLSSQRYLVGSQVTEADWRLFPTLVRFDAVYVGHFKCNVKRIADYPSLSNYLRDLYQYAGVADTVDLEHTKAHYYGSHDTINPTLVVPMGPKLELDQPHDRCRFKQ
ncbi:MAG: glutathione S-transferase family protein [Gammaproteobacteria bacterium]|nr:glutathione S-transferase family protein [Gammaproteobacteria bacterium]